MRGDTERTCSPGEHWDKTQQACVPNTVSPIGGTCPTGYHLDETGFECIADIVEPNPNDSWISKMPPLPAATATENLTGEHYVGNLNNIENLIWRLQGWIPGLASADPNVAPYSWVQALAPLGYKYVNPPYYTDGGVIQSFWPINYTGDSAGAPILQRHLSMAELGDIGVPQWTGGPRVSVTEYLQNLRDAGHSAQVVDSIEVLIDAGCWFNYYTYPNRPIDEETIPDWAQSLNLQVFNYKKLLPYFILDRIYFGGGWPASYGGWENGDGLELALKDGAIVLPEHWISQYDPRASGWIAQAGTNVGTATHPDWVNSNIDVGHTVGDVQVFYNKTSLYVWQFVNDNPLYRVYVTRATRDSAYTPPTPYWRCVAYGPYYDPAYY